jgi:hypothetical protein
VETRPPQGQEQTILTDWRLSLLHRPKECAILQQPSVGGVASNRKDGGFDLLQLNIDLPNAMPLPLKSQARAPAVHRSGIEQPLRPSAEPWVTWVTLGEIGWKPGGRGYPPDWDDTDLAERQAGTEKERLTRPVQSKEQQK